jgi:RimJ/RimL family protein N-acetyltransferase
VHGLNLSVPEDAREVIKPWNERESTEKYADSGVDDQVVIHVPFTENVRVRAILLKLGACLPFRPTGALEGHEVFIHECAMLIRI